MVHPIRERARRVGLVTVARAALPSAALITSLGTPAVAAARCPNEPLGDPACVAVASLALPTVHAEALAPRGKVSRGFLGGGFDLSLLSWSNNMGSLGPSQGSLRLGASYLRGPDERTLVAYRFSTLVSFEGNASRRFLIPTFGTAIGGLWETREGQKAAAEGLLGAYLLYTRHVVVDLQGGVLLPLSSSQALLGPKVLLSAGVALW